MSDFGQQHDTLQASDIERWPEAHLCMWQDDRSAGIRMLLTTPVSIRRCASEVATSDIDCRV